jgi:hypothetical protein
MLGQDSQGAYFMRADRCIELTINGHGDSRGKLQAALNTAQRFTFKRFTKFVLASSRSFYLGKTLKYMPVRIYKMQPSFKQSFLAVVTSPKCYPWLIGMFYGLMIRIVFSATEGGTLQLLGSVMGGSFVLGVPFAVDAITVFARPAAERTSGNAIGGASLAILLFVLGTGVLLLEGLICIVMALPLFLVLGIAGAGIAMLIVRQHDNLRLNIGIIACLPLLSSALEARLDDKQATSPAALVRHEVVREAVLNASAEAIWSKLVNTPEIPAGQYADSIAVRIGAPAPQSGATRSSTEGMIRRSFWGKSVYFDEPITALQEHRYLAWNYRFYPDSFPPGTMDEHVVIGGEYFDLSDTDFTLQPLPDGRTHLKIRIGFHVNTDFNWYALPVAELVLGNFADSALDYFGRVSE